MKGSALEDVGEKLEKDPDPSVAHHGLDIQQLCLSLVTTKNLSSITEEKAQRCCIRSELSFFHIHRVLHCKIQLKQSYLYLPKSLRKNIQQTQPHLQCFSSHANVFSHNNRIVLLAKFTIVKFKAMVVILREWRRSSEHIKYSAYKKSWKQCRDSKGDKLRGHRCV